MRDADERIERLMAGLRDAEPSPGMKRRILEAMEVHNETPSAWFLRPLVAAPLGCAAGAGGFVDRGHQSYPARVYACKRGEGLDSRRCWATHTAGDRGTQSSDSATTDCFG